MKKNNGFTLVELLAVIVILAIILAVAIPSITGIVNNTKKNAFEENTKLLLKAIDYKLIEDNSYDVTRIKKTTTEDTINAELKLDSSNYKTVSVTLSSNKPSVTIVGQSKWESLQAAGTYNNITITEITPDTTLPIITLLGNNPFTYDSCFTYDEPGATANDNIDGNISASIVINSSEIVQYTDGTYHVYYNVTDAAGNAAAQVTRTVIITSHVGICPSEP